VTDIELMTPDAAAPATGGQRLLSYVIDIVLCAGLVAMIARLAPLTGLNESLAVLGLLVVGRSVSSFAIGRTPGMILGALRPSQNSSRARRALRCLIEATPLYVIALSRVLDASTGVARAVFLAAIAVALVDNAVVPRLGATGRRGWSAHDRLSGVTTFRDEKLRATWKSDGLPWSMKALSAFCILCAVACIAY
jgi:hypothetical protein